MPRIAQSYDEVATHILQLNRRRAASKEEPRSEQ
jgi:hypothetical protein